VADEVADPRSGQRVVFRRIDAEVLELDLYVSKGAFVREHIHPTQEETLTGVAGTFVQVVNGTTHRIRAPATRSLSRRALRITTTSRPRIPSCS
jgi:hypothetical protein